VKFCETFIMVTVSQQKVLKRMFVRGSSINVFCRLIWMICCSKSNEHEEEVKKLYEEMEFQMKREQERILSEVSSTTSELLKMEWYLSRYNTNFWRTDVMIVLAITKNCKVRTTTLLKRCAQTLLNLPKVRTTTSHLHAYHIFYLLIFIIIFTNLA
jgi:hypothetical protein